MALREYRDLLVHMEWADSRIWSALLATESLREDHEMRERLYHFHTTQWAYLQAWQKKPLNIPELPTFGNLQRLGDWVRRYYLELREYLDGVRDSALDVPFDFPWQAEIEKHFGQAPPTTLGESLLQVVLHTMHHRGQVATRLRDRGGDPPLVDYIGWIWMGRPAPAWPAPETM